MYDPVKIQGRMKGNALKLRFIHAVLLLVFIMGHPVASKSQNKKIAIFGSSVAKGSGDTTGNGGYAGMITSLLEKRGWTVVNVSRGGDNTVKIMPRFEKELLPEKPAYVVIGLSLDRFSCANGA
jgi:lysophospholipase L1-like esterase